MTDPRLDPLLHTAVTRLVAGIAQAVDKTGTQMGMLALAAGSNAERQIMMNAEYDLQRRGTTMANGFAKDLGERVAKDRQRSQPESAAFADTDWTALRLVDNAEVEQTVTSAKLARQFEMDTELELRDLRGYFATLQDTLADEQVFPLRPDIVAKSLLKAVAQGSDDPQVRQQVLKVLTGHASQVLKACYEQILQSCREMRVAIAPLAVVRPANAPITGSPALPGADQASGAVPLNSAHATLAGTLRGDIPSGATPLKALGDLFGVVPLPEDERAGGAGGGPGGLGGSGGIGYGGGGGSGSMSALAKGLPGGFEAGAGWAGGGASGDAGPGAAAADGSPGNAGSAGASGRYVGDSSMLGLMRHLQSLASVSPGWTPSGQTAIGIDAPLPNLIRAHREELLQASGGAALDQMVIDIVATLFDQVLSDPKVAPQMARQIGRLQLPVLRVALRDQSFFHSRKHPVRRLINRMATLASAFDVLDDGPGRECIELVTILVRDIVDGDFDRIELYESKLGELEKFVAEQTARDAEENAAVAALLSGKEADLRVQQRYMQRVQQEMADLEAPEFLKVFLSQIWTQVLVMAATRHGAGSEPLLRMKQAGHQLVLSVQPKGTPSLRQDFLRGLPQLMKSLNEGMDMIQWPAEAKETFFAQLLPMHAEALKSAPVHDLTIRLLEQRLRKVEQIAIPSRDEAANDALPSHHGGAGDTGPMALAASMSPQDAQVAGWVSEAQVREEATDTANLDIDLSAGDEPDLLGVDIDIPLDVPPPPTAGPSLVDYIQPGAAYRMLLKGHWKKVRLTWVSDSRTFFMFTQGHHPSKQTISLTSRTLQQMCASGRFKAYEQAQLLERATLRARRQLAALNTQRKAAA